MIAAAGGSTAKADKKLEIALDESGILMLGAQILFGFYLRAVFHNRFDDLSLVLRVAHRPRVRLRSARRS
ncbi:MAG TPA: DUF6328 family protein [Xanthobacteraceae bacterium]